MIMAKDQVHVYVRAISEEEGQEDPRRLVCPSDLTPLCLLSLWWIPTCSVWCALPPLFWQQWKTSLSDQTVILSHKVELAYVDFPCALRYRTGSDLTLLEGYGEHDFENVQVDTVPL